MNYLGDLCTIGTKQGSCQDIRSCPEVLKAFRSQKIAPEVCNNVTRTVCCPKNVDPEISNQISEAREAIREFSNRTSAQSKPFFKILTI